MLKNKDFVLDKKSFAAINRTSSGVQSKLEARLLKKKIFDLEKDMNEMKKLLKNKE